ncbi:Ppx/GppA family phosphatase [Lusitaniella coriacea LEGE 07157]|uniref:Ppx/GppA family phosphatase n=1 Tax=Lusitaniella coriacea LEGE 07157 TaxID=945747 RepID=A0A8J7AMG6_9CYAN|nr:Ppx/GppA phosphatase family protein [Lusitaniella coriacea]MBE9114543.1 Ppx/GppA family phosphatase [Lusitaniella coriacea LEGE 07157]
MVDSVAQSKLDASNLSSDRAEDFNLAAIDIGTNSIHMVIARIHCALPALTIIAKEKDTVRLGDRDPKTKRLTPEAMQRALGSLRRCKDLAKAFEVKQIVAVATSAMREAPNGAEFLQQIEAEVGLQVNLISGPEEARRIYLGVLSCMDFQNKPQVVIDIGGGSTEIILADIYQPRFLSSTKVGAVRLTQDFVTTDPVSREQLGYLQAYVRGMLERPIDDLRAQLQPSEQVGAIGTSGTIKTLATIDAMEKTGSEPNPLQGYQLTLQALEKLLNRLASLSYEERSQIPGMDAKRSEIIVAGAVVLCEAMKRLELDSITICERALREGAIVDWMIARGFIEDRLCYQGEVRKRSVLKIARKYQVKMEYSERVANFALSLFNQLKGHLHDWGEDERELLWAAGMLHNSGLYISHSSHHKHSYYLIRNAELLGFTELEIELIANISRYHRKSKPKKKHESYNNLPSKEERILVNQLSAILRLAVGLDRRQTGTIQRVQCDFRPNSRKLKLYIFPTDPNDPCELELWNLDYKKVAFEEEFGVKTIAQLKLD